jgi:hypothetical protein
MSLSSYHISFAIGCPRKILKKGFAASSASDATAREEKWKKMGSVWDCPDCTDSWLRVILV